MQEFTLRELGDLFDCPILNEKKLNKKISALSTLELANKDCCAVFHNNKYKPQLRASNAGLCILRPSAVKHAPSTMALLAHPNPYKIFAKIGQMLYISRSKKKGFISPNAYIAESVSLGDDCIIQDGAYIGKGAIIGSNTEIGVNTYIGEDVVIGSKCLIENNVSINHSVIGNETIIHTGARIGQDGFGFASDENGHYKIPHMGSVKICNFVEIGANTCIDRGTFDATIIGDHCHIDNLVQIGHNVKLGKGVVLAGQCGIAGSTQLDDFVCMGGQSGVAGHLVVGAHSTILGKSGVCSDLPSNSRYAGFPALPAMRWHRKNRY